MPCVSCSALLPDGSRFCHQCGVPQPVRCAACSHANPPGSHFCGQCGAKLSPMLQKNSPHPTPVGEVPQQPSSSSTGASAERRLLTVMFCDLIGSTALSTSLDPEDLREVIASYHAQVAEVASQHSGFVAKYMGDGVLVYFGYPQAHEDDPERAIQAGLDIIDAIGQLTLPAQGLQVRVGIATGLAVVGDQIGSGASAEQAVVGEPPNLAARLQAAAAPNTVVIDETTHSLTGRLFTYADVGPIDAKGFGKPVPAWRVTGSALIESRFEALHSGQTPLIGRDEELELLLKRWDVAKQGEGRVILIGGEPGIGKSRLIVALRERLTGEAHVLRYFCSPQHMDTALYPVRNWLERSALFAPDDSLDQKREKLGRLLHHLSPDAHKRFALAELLNLPPSEQPALVQSFERRKELALAAMIDHLEAIARDRPVLSLWEDVHWLDEASHELLDRLIWRIRDLPVLLVLTFRSEFSPPWIGQVHVTLQFLNRLSTKQSTTLIENLAGGHVLQPEQVRHLLARTDGVPLYIEELTRTLIEADAEAPGTSFSGDGGPRGPASLPTMLQGALMARLDQHKAAKDLAQIGAVVGREFSYRLLEVVSGRPAPELREGLSRLVNSEVVLAHGQPPDATYSFKHALLQEAAYNSLLKSRRRVLHVAVADRLASTEQLVIPEVIAHHYTLGEASDKAIAWWRRAGEAAFRIGANAQAVVFYRRAIELIRKLPPSDPTKRAELECCLALRLPVQALTDRRSNELREVLSQALQLSEELDAREHTIETLYALYMMALNSAQLTDAVGMAQRLSDLADDEEGPDYARSLAIRALGTCLFAMGRFEEAIGYLQDAAKVLEGADLHQPRLFAHAGLVSKTYWGWALLITGKPREGALILDAARDYVDNINPDVQMRLMTLNNLALARFSAGDRMQLRPIAAAAMETLKQVDRTDFAGGISNVFYHAVGLSPTSDVWASEETARNFMRSQHIELGAYLEAPTLYAAAARALAQRGNPAAGAALLDEALGAALATEERWYEAELMRLKAETALEAGLINEPEAIRLIMQAREIACAQNANLFELRSAISLARLWRTSPGRGLNIREVLTPLLDQFAPDDELPELADARILLDEAFSSHSRSL